jgi:hypothetical protein
VLPLIRSVRTNARELLAELLADVRSDLAWPVLGALIATHVTSILLILCLLRCARTALARCGPGASAAAPGSARCSSAMACGTVV